MEEKLTRLYHPEDFQRASMYCLNALEILEEADIESDQEDLDWWLEEYDGLYRLLTNQPPGLPPIPRTTCFGIIYPSLSEFWRRYHRLKFPPKDALDQEGEDSQSDDQI